MIFFYNCKFSFIPGILTVLLVYVVQNLGAVLQLAISIIGACGGPLAGVFVIGFLMPSIKGNSTFYAAILSVILTTSLVMKAQMEVYKLPTKEMRVDGCVYGNFTVSNIDEKFEPKFYQISYLYYTLFGALTSIVFAIIFSIFYGFQNPEEVDRKLVAPFMRRKVKESNYEKVEKSSLENNNKMNECIKYELINS